MTSNAPAVAERDIARSLVAWFAEGARDLPWRRDRTGYRVWVSEVMLQQTRVATVIPYFERFLARFPTVRALAEAPQSDVLAMWSGLGYYRRARALHEGARDVVERFGGEVPRTVIELKTVRGIGPYTAGAIASLAFGEREALVDGNVARVFARLFAIEEDLRLSRTQKKIWQLATELVPEATPGAFNEALMELGATICTPREPKCEACPLSKVCAARASGREKRLPFLSPKKDPTLIHAAALVSRKDGAVLLARRRGDALFGGMWEPPMVEAESKDDARDAANAFASKPKSLGQIVHVLSHRKMSVEVLGGKPRAAAEYPAIYDEVRFVNESELASYGISTLCRKILGGARKGESGE